MRSILGVERGNSAVDAYGLYSRGWREGHVQWMHMDSTAGQMLELADKDFKVVLTTTLTMSRKLSNLSKSQQQQQKPSGK